MAPPQPPRDCGAPRRLDRDRTPTAARLPTGATADVVGQVPQPRPFRADDRGSGIWQSSGGCSRTGLPEGALRDHPPRRPVRLRTGRNPRGFEAASARLYRFRRQRMHDWIRAGPTRVCSNSSASSVMAARHGPAAAGSGTPDCGRADRGLTRRHGLTRRLGAGASAVSGPRLPACGRSRRPAGRGGRGCGTSSAPPRGR